MTKNTLLAAVAVGALAIAGSASAHDLVFRSVPADPRIDLSDTYQGPVAGPDSTTTDAARYNRPVATGLQGLYLIAEETAVANLGTNTVALSDLLTAGSQLPSGNNLYTVTLSNGTFTTAVTTANLVATANCTIAASSGGAQGSNTVTFIVSASGGGACTGFNEVNLPIAPSGPGTVSVTARFATDNDVPIDGGNDNLDVFFAIDAFQPAFNASFTTANAGPGAGVDSFAQIAPATVGGLPYTVLAGDNDLGRLAIYVDTRAQRNLTPGNFVTPTDVTAATVTVTGDFSAFDGLAGAPGNPTLTSGTAVGGINPGVVSTSTVTGNTATFTGVQGNIVQPLVSKPNGSVFEVFADGGQIPNSTYSASIAYTLNPAVFSAQNASPVAGSPPNFESIDREGTNFIAPWTGGSQAASQSVIRLSNTGVATGAVTLVLTNAVVTGNTQIPDATCNAGIVPAAGDLVIGQAQMSACFGAFLRGDLLITVEGAPTSLTAKMRNTNTTGTFETTLGRYSGSNITGAAQ